MPESYYFDYDANIKVGNETIKSVYRPCFHTCKYCIGNGTYTSNACTSCKDGYKQYEFNKQQCTIDYNKCLENDTYWKLDNNNIICINNCNSSFIISGSNKGQFVIILIIVFLIVIVLKECFMFQMMEKNANEKRDVWK